MRRNNVLSAGFAMALLTACGGSGGTPTPSPAPTPSPTPTPTPAPTLDVSLSSNSVTLDLDEGGSATFGFTANFTGSSTLPIIADVEIGGRRYALTGSPVVSGNQVTVALETLPFPAGGSTSTDVDFRLCTSTDCSSVYPGSSATFTVDLDVTLRPWGTFQRDAAHTGYVGAAYDEGNFEEAWSFDHLGSNNSAVAARSGTVFANFFSPSGRLVTRALSTVDGAQQWSVDLGPNSYYGAPSYDNDRVVSATMNTSSTAIPMQILGANDGVLQGTVTYPSQFAQAGTPTLIDDNLYLQSGYFGNTVYGYELTSATRIWDNEPLGGSMGYVHEGQSVAADADYVYFYGISALFVHSRSTGAVVKTISDPFFSMAGLSYHGSYYGGPVLDGQGGIYSFSENKYRDGNNPIAAYDFAAGTMRWRSSQTYIDAFALRGGKLYAPRGSSTLVDVLNTATGALEASFDVGAGEGELTSNVIATESHVFVASDSKTYAISLTQAGNPVVWTAPRGGDLAITPDNQLIISGSGGVIAYKLF